MLADRALHKSVSNTQRLRAKAAQFNELPAYLHLQAKLSVASALLALLAFLLCSRAFVSTGSPLFRHNHTEENLHFRPAHYDLVTAPELHARRVAGRFFRAEANSVQKGAVQTAEVTKARDAVCPKNGCMLAGHVGVGNLDLLQQTHVDTADALGVSHNSASFVSDFPHRAFEWTVDNLQNQKNGKPECFDGALLPVRG